MIVSPRAAFDAMIIPAATTPVGQRPSSNNTSRILLILVAILAAIFYGQWVRWIGSHRDGGQVIVAPLLLILLTYTEAIGVTYFARKRGWRVPFRLAERIVCYASIGWLPAMIVLPPLIILQGQTPFLPAWASWIPLRGELTDWLLIAIVGGVASLWFESLVWLGVRRLRFANARALI